MLVQLIRVQEGEEERQEVIVDLSFFLWLPWDQHGPEFMTMLE